jgi:hypothetical protein
MPIERLSSYFINMIQGKEGITQVKETSNDDRATAQLCVLVFPELAVAAEQVLRAER